MHVKGLLWIVLLSGYHRMGRLWIFRTGVKSCDIAALCIICLLICTSDSVCEPLIVSFLCRVVLYLS